MPRLRRVSSSSPGFTRVRRGRGWAYLVTRGQRITDPAVVDRISRLAIPPAYTDVWICPVPNGHLQAVGTADRAQAGRRPGLRGGVGVPGQHARGLPQQLRGPRRHRPVRRRRHHRPRAGDAVADARFGHPATHGAIEAAVQDLLHTDPVAVSRAIARGRRPDVGPRTLSAGATTAA